MANLSCVQFPIDERSHNIQRPEYPSTPGSHMSVGGDGFTIRSHIIKAVIVMNRLFTIDRDSSKSATQRGQLVMFYIQC